MMEAVRTTETSVYFNGLHGYVSQKDLIFVALEMLFSPGCAFIVTPPHFLSNVHQPGCSYLP
jgi:hypothetical protein